jgi:hypothetical protein
MLGQALIAANSPPYWQNQQQRQAEKGPVFIAINCWDWYYYPIVQAIGPSSTARDQAIGPYDLSSV